MSAYNPPLNEYDSAEYYPKELANTLVTPGLTNPNNCETCKYKHMNEGEEGHCYMFKDEPTDVCMQHSGREDYTFMTTKNMDLSELFSTCLKQAVLDIEHEEEQRWLHATLPKMLKEQRKKWNKRKKQRRATTGRRR
jgi:hypothetical protein